MSTNEADAVARAIAGRHSVRAYRPDPVPRETLEEILRVAGHAPSGSNIQPWRVYVLSGARLERLRGAMRAAYLAGEKGHGREYRYYTDEPVEPYKARQRTCGWGLYGLLGIGRGDFEKSRAYRVRNYEFFGAPVGLVFTIDRRLELGSWLDYGMFLQNIMVLARAHGLDTCPEASIAEFPKIIRAQLEIDETEMVICGMALGYADETAPINGYRTPREELQVYARFFE